MTLHSDFLEQARHLANRERRRPRQASLRRAISTAYYALYHLFVAEATRLLIRPDGNRERFARALEHSNIKSVARAFANAHPTRLAALTDGHPISTDLEYVAKAAIELQASRHDADYNLQSRFFRIEANNVVATASAAFDAWHRTRNDPASRCFLAALILWKHWNR